MIMILADGSDPWAMAVHRELGLRGVSASMISPETLLADAPLNYTVTSQSMLDRGTLTMSGSPVPLTNLTGVLCRMPFPIQLELEDLTPHDRDYVKKETSAAWLALLNALTCRVVNRPVPGGLPTLLTGQPALLPVAERLGLSVPSCYCTTDVDDAIRRFIAWGERAYVKPRPNAFRFVGSRRRRDGAHPRMDGHGGALAATGAGRSADISVCRWRRGGGDGGAGKRPVIERCHLQGSLVSAALTRCADFVSAMGLGFAECLVVAQPDGRFSFLDVSGSPNFWRCPLEVRHVAYALGHISLRREESSTS